MNRIYIFTVTLGCFALVASALAQQSKPSPELEAMGGKLMQEINANIQCNANQIAGRNELEKLQKEIEGLKKELADAKQVPSTSSPNGRSGAQP